MSGKPPTVELTFDLLENSSTRDSAVVRQLCFELGGHLITNPLYRGFQIMQGIECSVALVALPVILYKFLIQSALHFNLKALLCLYFHIGIAYVLTILTCLIYELVIRVSYRNPCDMFPTRTMYAVFTVLEVYFLMHMLSLQLVITAERTVATVYVDTYESWSKKSAIFFVIATFIIPGVMMLYFYIGVRFTEAKLHCLYDQSTVAGKISEGSVLVIILSLASVAVQRILCIVNKKRTLRFINKPLTTRYQLSENIAGTSLTSRLQILQVSASILYSVLTLVCSELNLAVGDNKRDTNLIVKEGCYFIPLAVAILPFLTLHLLRKRQRVRNNSIQQSVSRSNADDVPAIYATMLKRQWE